MSFNIFTITVYLPYFGHKKVPFDETLRQISNAITQNSSEYDMIIVTGDFNAKIGRDGNNGTAGRWTVHVNPNEIGIKIQDLALEMDLFAVSTKFQPKKRATNVTYKREMVGDRLIIVLLIKGGCLLL